MRKQNSVRLKEKERNVLQELISKGKEKARTLTRCRILLLADKGETDSGIIKAWDQSEIPSTKYADDMPEKELMRQYMASAWRPQ